MTGLLVPPADAPGLHAALARLCAEPQLRARLGDAGLARALDCYDEAVIVADTVGKLGRKGLLFQEKEANSF